MSTNPKTGLRYLFPVPDEYVGEKDVVLVAEHPGFTLNPDGKDFVVEAEKVGIVRAFPSADGWYAADPEYGIPAGAPVDMKCENARYLVRFEKAVSLISLGYFDGGNEIGNPRGIVVGEVPSTEFGVPVIFPNGCAFGYEDSAPSEPAGNAVINGATPAELLELCKAASGQLKAIVEQLGEPAANRIKALLDTIRLGVQD